MNQPDFPDTPAPAPDQGPDDEELAAAQWRYFDDEIAATPLWHKIRRLPALTASALRWAWQANPRDLVVSMTLSALSAVLGAVSLASVTRVLDALVMDAPMAERVDAALMPLLVVAGVAVLSTTARLGSNWAQSRLGPQIERIVETQLFDLTTRVRVEAFDNSEFNDAMYRSRDRGMYEVPKLVTRTLDVLSGIIGLVSIAGVLALLHIILVPLLVLTVLPIAWSAVRAARMEYDAQRRLSTGRRRRWILGDRMAARDPATELRAYTMGPSLLRDYAALADQERSTMLTVAWQQTRARAIGEGASGLAALPTYAALGFLLISGAMPLAAAGTAVMAMGQSQARMQTLIYALNSVYESGLYYSDYQEFCSLARSYLAQPPTRPAPAQLKELRVRTATYTYPTASEPSLRDVDVRVSAGEIIALVGKNGSGKSTLGKLMCGLYLPHEGAVEWNGVDITEHGSDLQQRIAMIIQDHTRWPMSAERNVTMNQDCVTSRRDQAAQLSGADEVIEGLDRGWNTLLDPAFARGVNLSGGQWQRLASARGIYRVADLLIADEPTSALDPEAELQSFETIRTHALRTGAAVVLSTHRLSSVRMADRIYVLHEGRVVEHGTHAELMDLQGRYARLFNLQASSFTDEPDV